MIKNIREILPNWDNPEQRTAYAKNIYAYARQMGFNDGEIRQFQLDGRIALMVIKAMKFDNAKI